MSEVGDNIYKYRKMRGLTLQELADAVKTTRQTMQRYESGEITGIPYDRLLAIAKKLGISPSVLMGWDSLKTDMAVSSDEVQLIELYRSMKSKERLLEYAKKLKAVDDLE